MVSHQGKNSCGWKWVWLAGTQEWGGSLFRQQPTKPLGLEFGLSTGLLSCDCV